MSKNEFMIHYANCKNFNREIKSNINYLEDIIDRVTTSNEKLDSMTKNGKKVWNPDDTIDRNDSLKSSLSSEKERYEKLYVNFEKFYVDIENMDSQLASYVTSQISYLDENDDNYEFLIAVIQLNNNDVITENVYQMLLDSGLTEEEAKNIVILLSVEGQNELIRLSHLSIEELEKEKKRLSDKQNKTLLETVISELLSYPNPKNFINDLVGALSDNSFTAYVEKAILGRSLVQAKLDVKSIQGSINKLMEQIVTPNLSKSAKLKTKKILTHLNAIGGARLAKIKFAEGTIKGIEKLGKAVSAAIIVIDTLENYNENKENYELYGVDQDRASYDFLIDETGLIASIAVGTKIGGSIGALGGPIASVVGVIIGAVASVAADVVINKAGDILFDNILEPATDWWNDTCNDVGDWWDTLWW